MITVYYNWLIIKIIAYKLVNTEAISGISIAFEFSNAKYHIYTGKLVI